MLELIYPPVCGMCDRINKNNICINCKAKIKKYLINDIENCKNNKEVYYDYRIKILKYENMVRERIIEYKFREKTYIYKTLEKIILNNEKIYSFLKKYDIIMPVPMYKKKKLERGYNQTELIARELSKDLEIELDYKNLKKIKNTKTQSKLTKAERKENIKNAFMIKNTFRVEGKKIILFDDIYTTGSTLNECSRILKEAKVKEIAILTIAID